MTADTALIKRALEQAKERIVDWSGDFQGEIFAKNTIDLLNLAIQEAEKLQSDLPSEITIGMLTRP